MMRHYIDLVESAEKTYLHGSPTALEIGTRLHAQAKHFPDMLVESVFEDCRPSNLPSRAQSVFMVDRVATLREMGLERAYLYVVRPLGVVHRFDALWVEMACEIAATQADDDYAQIGKCAVKYWSGAPCDGSPLWEYLTESAKVIDTY